MLGQGSLTRGAAGTAGRLSFTAVLLCGIVLGGVASAQYSEGVDLSADSAAPGGGLTVSGDGFAPHATVRVTLESTPVLLAITEADATGFFSATIQIPEDVDPGTHTVKATGKASDGGVLVLSSRITIEGERAGSERALRFLLLALLVMVVLVAIVAIALGVRAAG